MNLWKTDTLKFPPSEHDLERFIKAAIPAPHGKDQATVYDPEYRLAKEYKVSAIQISPFVILLY